MPIITIAGDPASGKSTLARQLSELFEIPHFSMGDVFKEMAREKNMTATEFSKIAEMNPDIYDRKVDEYQAHLPEKHRAFVIDSRLGFHFIPESIKIYVRCDFHEAARRFLKEGRIEEPWKSPVEGAKRLKERQESEKKRYMDLYGIDHTDMKNYDFVVDSTEMTPEEKFKEVLAYLESQDIEVPE